MDMFQSNHDRDFLAFLLSTLPVATVFVLLVASNVEIAWRNFRMASSVHEAPDLILRTRVENVFYDKAV